MQQFVIIEKLKEAIGDQKVIAAVFYTYNFDARFFENYILTTFLPHVNFSDNEIQNTILWRKYANDLPPVTVYCDFHAKNPEAPGLNYKVNSIDLPARDGQKACFHPKVSFILLEDWSLIIMVGSNNISEGGWCRNKEIVGIKTLKNNEFFPYDQKHQLWNFFKWVFKLSGESVYSKAETLINDFFWQRKHTPESDFHFYDSSRSSFLEFIKGILLNQELDKFEHVEIISPYLSPGVELVKDVLDLVEQDQLYINLPYKTSNEADITEKNYRNYEAEGVKWSRFIQPETEKGFRFNHSKVYRLKTTTKIFTILGSVNFTDAAWKGTTSNGNIETAMVFESPALEWKPWLEAYENMDITFVSEQSDETATDERIDAPDLKFELDWREETLKYTNYKKYDFFGIIRFKIRNVELKTGVVLLDLSNEMIDELVENPVIQVKQYHTQRELFYYPLQLSFDSKPIPQKLKLKDGELIALWENVSIREETKSEITDLIEKFIVSRLNKEGDLVDDSTEAKSTLNMMASHIGALIRLEERIFDVPKLKRDYPKAKELADYYLFTSNIDTLSGYRNLLAEIYEEQAILPGVYWFLLNVLLKDFYNATKIKRFYKNVESVDSTLNSRISQISKVIAKCADSLKKELKDKKVDMELLHWIKAEL